jgi:SAM-dependent methyltransferase
MRPPDSFSLLRLPATGTPVAGHRSPATHRDHRMWTGVLASSSGEVPVLGGVVLLRKEFVSARVIRYAKEGRYYNAVASALRAGGVPGPAVTAFLGRLRWPRLLQFHGSPDGGTKGDERASFRYRYSVSGAPATIGVLSCLNRTGAKDGYLLDIGSGLGHFYPYHLHTYPADRVVLLDRSLSFLLATSRFVDHRSLLVCADGALPFPEGAFLDVVVLDGSRYLKGREDRVVHSALRVLDKDRGTLWVAHNVDPRAADDGGGDACLPSAWLRHEDSDRWRIFPDIHFAHSVLRGGMINLAVDYAADDPSSIRRSYTVAYSNAAWTEHTRFMPLNRVPNLQRLHVNPLYSSSSGRHSFVKRRVALQDAGARDPESRLELPDTVHIPSKNGAHRAQVLRELAESLVMVESLCGRSRGSPSALAGVVAVTKLRVRSSLRRARWFNAILPLIPRGVRTLGARLLRDR